MNQKQGMIEQLFRSHYKRMFHLAMVLLHDEEDSRDAVSDVFARLMQAGKMPYQDNIENYLLTAVRHRCLDFIAHQQVRQRMERLLPTDNVVYLSETSEERRFNELRRFVDTELPEQTQQVFRLRFDGHKKYQEIAEELNISEKTVYKHLHIAVTKLHEHFNSQEL